MFESITKYFGNDKKARAQNVFFLRINELEPSLREAYFLYEETLLWLVETPSLTERIPDADIISHLNDLHKQLKKDQFYPLMQTYLLLLNTHLDLETHLNNFQEKAEADYPFLNFAHFTLLKKALGL